MSKVDFLKLEDEALENVNGGMIVDTGKLGTITVTLEDDETPETALAGMNLGIFKLDAESEALLTEIAVKMSTANARTVTATYILKGFTTVHITAYSFS